MVYRMSWRGLETDEDVGVLDDLSNLPHPALSRLDGCRDVQTVQMDGVLRPEGLKLRVVKASGRTLEETKFHMEIRTQRPGQARKCCLVGLG